MQSGCEHTQIKQARSSPQAEAGSHVKWFTKQPQHRGAQFHCTRPPWGGQTTRCWESNHNKTQPYSHESTPNCRPWGAVQQTLLSPHHGRLQVRMPVPLLQSWCGWCWCCSCRWLSCAGRCWASTAPSCRCPSRPSPCLHSDSTVTPQRHQCPPCGSVGQQWTGARFSRSMRQMGPGHNSSGWRVRAHAPVLGRWTGASRFSSAAAAAAFFAMLW